MSKAASAGKREGFALTFEPRNESQRLACERFPSCDLMFLLGPAGCGKSITALALALREIKEGRASRVLLSRPAVGPGENYGYLKGDLSEKVAPWLAALNRLKRKLALKASDELFEFRTFQHLQGDTFEDCVAVLDEAQNVDYDTLKLYISRAGEGCKMLINGDPYSSFIRPKNTFGYDVDLDCAADRLQGKPGIELVEFSDQEIVRSRLAALAFEHL